LCLNEQFVILLSGVCELHLQCHGRRALSPTIPFHCNGVYIVVRIEEVNEDHIASAGQLKMITDGTESKKRKKDQVSKKEADKSAVKSAVEDGDGDSSEDEDGFALPGKHSDSKCPVVFGYILLGPL